jgi:hypothetical protein
MSFEIGYLTLALNKNDYLDTSWLDQNPADFQSDNIRHISLPDPVEIILNGKRNFGMIIKPGLT